MLNLIIIIILFVFIFLLSNCKYNIDTLLVDFNLDRPLLCRTVCPGGRKISDGDCLEQCITTLQGDIDEYKKISEMSEKDRIAYIAAGKFGPQDFAIAMPEKRIPIVYSRYKVDSRRPFTAGIEHITHTLIDIFVKIPTNKARLVRINRYDFAQIHNYEDVVGKPPDTGELIVFYHHFIILANYNNDLYLIDPKNAIVSKNKDIVDNPFQSQTRPGDGGTTDTFNWGSWQEITTYIELFPTMNIEGGDDDVEHDRDFIKTQLETGNPQLIGLDLKAFSPNLWCNLTVEEANCTGNISTTALGEADSRVGSPFRMSLGGGGGGGGGSEDTPDPALAARHPRDPKAADTADEGAGGGYCTIM
tara:strand:- start:488 stop:1567 length:1080 start_codon:yes stop_codon:yes gene_type:complete